MNEKNVKHIIHYSNGSEEEVAEDQFQHQIDLDLAEYNDGVIPTTDEERQIIINRIKRLNQ